MTTHTFEERTGVVTGRGNPLTLVGPSLKVGDRAPDVHFAAKDLSVVSLDDLLDGGKRAALLIVVPSLDTSVCSLESRTFNKRIRELPAGVKAYVVSVDLPFAQARWCSGEEGEIDLEMLSDYRLQEFGRRFGVYVKETGLLARSTFVVAKDGTIAYAEIVPEITTEPNYDAAIVAAKAAG